MFAPGFFLGLVAAVALCSSRRSGRHATAWLAGFALATGLAFRFLGLL